MKFEIKSRFDSSILFSIETESWKLAVEAAVKTGADLNGAYLKGAYLKGADLKGAYLKGADLTGAYLNGAYLKGAAGIEKFPIQIGAHRHWLCTTHDGKLQIGCHVHSFEQWKKRAEAIGGLEGYSERDIEIYKLHIEHIEKISKLLWGAKS